MTYSNIEPSVFLNSFALRTSLKTNLFCPQTFLALLAGGVKLAIFKMKFNPDFENHDLIP